MELDLTQYFNDPDSDVLIIDFVDDATTEDDDNHPFLIDIDINGVAKYDPAIKQNNQNISSWTIENNPVSLPSLRSSERVNKTSRQIFQAVLILGKT